MSTNGFDGTEIIRVLARQFIIIAAMSDFSLVEIHCGLKTLETKPSSLRTNLIVRLRTTSMEGDAAKVTVNEATTTKGACYLELKVLSRSIRDGCWNFVDRYGYHYADAIGHPLLPLECICLSQFPCHHALHDISVLMVTKVSRQVEIIKNSTSGKPNIESLEVEVHGLQAAACHYLLSRVAKDIFVPMVTKVSRQMEIIKNSTSGKSNFESLEVEVHGLQAVVGHYLLSRVAMRDFVVISLISVDFTTAEMLCWLDIRSERLLVSDVIG
ncbi:hypothetical protein Tco_1539949 [Tanacetum coccineum]